MMDLRDPRPNALCPICGWKEWTAVPLGIGEGVEPAPAAIKALRLPYEVGAAPFACDRCGFVRFHVERRS